jgi:hypothetical protein
MILPEPQTRTFSTLISDIGQGQIKIPQFQREFVWDLRKCASLMDSIVKGYPIGTLIFWKTKERLRSVRDIGGCTLPEPDEGDFVEFVLDGQQRLTALFASLKGLKVEREGARSDDFAEMYVDLEAKEDEQIIITDVSGKDENSIIRIMDLLYGGLTLLAKYPEKYYKKLEEYKGRIVSYNYSLILVKDAPIDIATEIFTRINVGGKPLTLFEIMVAKTFEPKKDFDLSEKYAELIDDLKPLNYETLSDATVLQTISLLLDDECKRQTILKLDKNEFINIWSSAVDAIERAVEYFKGFYRIPVSQLLPYNALIVPFAYFFYHHPDKPTGEKQKYLEDFFWRCSLSGRYSSGVEGKLAQDVKRIDKILKDELPTYDWSIDTSPEFIIRNGWFSAGRSYVKAILCIYAYHQPKSFNDNSLININNYWLKQVNSKNYHHFFPRAYLKGSGWEDNANHILNITIVDDFLNKREIKAQAPSKYMRTFERVNPHLAETMKTHLILDLGQFGVWEDNYQVFINERARALSNELQERIIKQEIDKKGQPEQLDDYDESAPELIEVGK